MREGKQTLTRKEKLICTGYNACYILISLAELVLGLTGIYFIAQYLIYCCGITPVMGKFEVILRFFGALIITFAALIVIVWILDGFLFRLYGRLGENIKRKYPLPNGLRDY